jgi:hypothetical protein
LQTINFWIEVKVKIFERLSSRREINRELSGAVINHHLRKIFPELDSIPHADTLARLLERINVEEIEHAHIALIKQLINGKKFKKLLINQCLPITIDGCQKLFRNGLLHDSHWLQRTVGNDGTKINQQYVYGAPRKCHSASSWKCCRESADPAHVVPSLGQIAVMQ